MAQNTITGAGHVRVAEGLRVLFRRASDLESLCEYIDRQEEHHKQRTFQEEFRMFLEKYHVEYNEAYVWD